ncbi:MAG: hypothetical protein WKG07_11870 [Hymenobacter sp.]
MSPAGILAIYALNVGRVALLALSHAYWYHSVDFNHHYTFTFVVYGASWGPVGTVWARRGRHRPLAGRARTARCPLAPLRLLWPRRLLVAALVALLLGLGLFEEEALPRWAASGTPAGPRRAVPGITTHGWPVGHQLPPALRRAERGPAAAPAAARPLHRGRCGGLRSGLRGGRGPAEAGAAGGPAHRLPSPATGYSTMLRQ